MNAARRSSLALLLLVCFLRTLLPEAWILALHAHAHTPEHRTEKPIRATGVRHLPKGKALLSAKHQHCPVEQFYDGAFQVSVPVLVPTPRLAPVYAGRTPLLAVPRPLGMAGGPVQLRGPPACG